MKDPRPPWVEAVTVGYVAAGVLLFSTPALADTAAEAVDSHSVKYPFKQALKEEKEGGGEAAFLARMDTHASSVTSELQPPQPPQGVSLKQVGFAGLLCKLSGWP